MRRAEIGSSLFWLALGVYVCIHALVLGIGRPNEPGPGFMFFLGGVLLSLFSIIHVCEAFALKEDRNEPQSPLWAGLKWKKVVMVFVFLCAWTYFFDHLGFFVSTFLLLVLLFRSVEPIKWWVSIFVALVTVVVSYLFFSVWLKVPFPQGFMGI